MLKLKILKTSLFLCFVISSALKANPKITVDSLLKAQKVSFNIKQDTATLLLSNKSNLTTNVFLRIGTEDIFKYHSIDIFRNIQGLNHTILIKQNSQNFYNGPLISYTLRKNHPDLQTFKIKLKANQDLKLFVKINNKGLKATNQEIHFYSSEKWDEIRNKELKANQTSLYFSLLFIGGLIIMILFSLLVYLENKVNDFLYYAGYLIFVLLFSIVADFPTKYNTIFIWDFPQISLYSKEALVYGYLICYHLFLIQFLKLKEHIVTVYKWLISLNYMFTFLLTINLIALFIASLTLQNLLYKINTVILFAVIPCYGYIIYRLFKMRHLSYYKYILWGILFFYLGNIAGTLSQVFDWNFGGLFPNNYTQIGTFIELCFFSLGLGSKMIEESREKIKFQNQVLETQMMALQTQMNPHFTFNCLNAIRNLVLKKETEKASAYLLKFSKMLRLTLENSVHKEVSLEDNLTYIEMYLSMEKLRFGDSLNFQLKQKLVQNSAAILIPPMLVQPFIENAIKHAFTAEITQKNITISFVESEDVLMITIEDNGVGVDAKPKNYGSHTSRATQIIDNYLLRWNTIYQHKIKLEIDDKKTINLHESGTIVRIELDLAS